MPVLIASFTWQSRPLPAASARMTMSRSVMVPTSRSFSPTGSSPTSISFIVRAASWMVSFGAHKRTWGVMQSEIFIRASRSMGFRLVPRPVQSALGVLNFVQAAFGAADHAFALGAGQGLGVTFPFMQDLALFLGTEVLARQHLFEPPRPLRLAGRVMGGQQLDQAAAESGQIVGIAAGYQFAVDDRLLVDPDGAGIFQVGLERRPRGHLAPAHDVGFDQAPRAMADGADRLAGAEEVGDECHGLGIGAQPVGVGDAARQHEAGEIGLARFADRQVDIDPGALLGMSHALNLSRLEADHQDRK